MFSKDQLSHNKWIRGLAYTIVIGFALLMFLPTTISLNELFRPTAPKFIEVNGEEIFLSNFPLYEDQPQLSISIESALRQYLSSSSSSQNPQNPQNTLTQEEKAELLYTMLQNWQTPNKNPDLESIRSFIVRAIRWQLNTDLTKELDIELSKKDFQNLMKKSYLLYLQTQYQEQIQQYSENQEDLPNWQEFLEEYYEYFFEGYANWAENYLHDQYLENQISSSFQNGILIPLVELEKEFEIQSKQVQVEYALYGYQDFLKEPEMQKKITAQQLRKFHEAESRIRVQKVQFSSKEKANHALRDEELFRSDEESPYQSEELELSRQNPVFETLKNYKKEEITSPILEKDSSYSLYKILQTTQSFENIQNDPEVLQNLMYQYAKPRYEQYQKDYENYAKQLLQTFLKKKESSFTETQNQNSQLQNVRVGKTGLFHQNTLILLSEGQSYLQDDNTEDFISFSVQGRKYSSVFLNQAFSLKKGKVSEKILQDQSAKNDEQIFFLLKKIDEKLPDPKDFNHERKREYLQSQKQSLENIFQTQWISYLIKQKNQVAQINAPIILRYFELEVPNLSLSFVDPSKKETAQPEE